MRIVAPTFWIALACAASLWGDTRAAPLPSLAKSTGGRSELSSEGLAATSAAVIEDQGAVPLPPVGVGGEKILGDTETESPRDPVVTPPPSLKDGTLLHRRSESREVRAGLWAWEDVFEKDARFTDKKRTVRLNVFQVKFGTDRALPKPRPRVRP